jgi:hypothetical protein
MNATDTQAAPAPFIEGASEANLKALFAAIEHMSLTDARAVQAHLIGALLCFFPEEQFVDMLDAAVRGAR